MDNGDLIWIWQENQETHKFLWVHWNTPPENLNVPHAGSQIFIIKMWIHVTLCQSEFVQVKSNPCWHDWVRETDAASSPGNQTHSPIPSPCWGYQEHWDWPSRRAWRNGTWSQVLFKYYSSIIILFSLNLLLCSFFRQATDCICFLKLCSAATANTKHRKNFGLKSLLY